METRDEFVEARRARWHELEALIAGDQALSKRTGSEISRIAALYRMVSHDLMRARSLGCGADVTTHLDALAGRVHNLLYAPRPWHLAAIWELVARGFPRAVRTNWRSFLLASALLYVPFAFGLWMTLETPAFAHVVVPAGTLEQMADSYREGFGSGREGGQGSMMAGFYVYNNVGIAFRCFATGIVFGLGSVFFLVYNGLVTGAVVGFVINAGAGANIGTFICGHAPFELTAIVVSGAAGIRLGWALLDTRGRSRLGSLRASARELFELVSGAALLLLIAAGLEAFWSPSSIPQRFKLGFSATMIVALSLYFLLAGRQRAKRGAAA